MEEMITPKTDRAEENVCSRYSDPSIIIKDYPQEKLFAVLNVNRKPFLEISIDDLGLGTKALNPLFRHDKTAIKDVLSLSVKELLRFRGLGVKSVKEIITQLLFYFQEHPELVSPCNAEDEAAKRLGITAQKAAQTEQTALELFHGTYIREDTNLVMMVYALKLGRQLLLTDELAAYIGETASLLQFACRQGLQFPRFTYDESDYAFLISADEWEYKAFEQSRDAIRRSLPFRFWLEETGALAPNEIEQCVAALLKAEGLEKSNDLGRIIPCSIVRAMSPS